MMSRWWVTTRFGDRVDAAHAFWVQHRFADGREHEMPDRHLLELVWENHSETLAVFLDRSDCIRALDAFVRQGWVRGEPDVYMCEGRAVNPARIRACRVETSDAGQTWRAQLDVAAGAFPQPIAAGPDARAGPAACPRADRAVGEPPTGVLGRPGLHPVGVAHRDRRRGRVAGVTPPRGA
jgi:hypothetical protein